MVTQNAKVARSDEPRLAIPTGDDLLPANAEFAEKFNRSDFLFDHGLAHHPLFELPALLGLADRIPKYKDFVYWQNGRVKVNDRWEANPAPRRTLEETIEGIAHNDSLVILKHAEQDPIYGPVLQEILQRIFSFTSPAAQDDIVLGESLIFINSPHRTTAYHLDLESNFLLQIAGDKFIHVHDCANRSVTPHEELENHCGGNYNGAVFKPARRSEAHDYHLTAGHGVHFPSTAPHWVENGDEVSVSININFDLVSVHQRLKRIYSLNRVLRRLGMKPAPPGLSPLRDAIKQRASGGVDRLLQMLPGRAVRHPDAAPASYPAWRPTRRRASAEPRI
ncbi:MAG: transcription factor jumonji JmjC domain protein [Gammaproteobacteria bacterium]|nr:transcription factor jumonji JmjC domain protein [Gammaproteobacteria bacterium]